jgi:hypothetical protein
VNTIYLPQDGPFHPVLGFPLDLAEYLSSLANERFSNWRGIPRICRIGPYSSQEIDLAWVADLHAELQELLAVLYDWRERLDVPHQLTDPDCGPEKFGPRRFCEWTVDFIALCERALAQEFPLVIAGD